MKTLAVIIVFLFVQSSLAQVTVAPTKYDRSFKSFSGLPTYNSWSKDSLAVSRGVRQVSIDNKNGADTLWYGFGASDTATTKRYRLYPGQIANWYFDFIRDIVMFWRSAGSDTTKQIKWDVK